MDYLFAVQDKGGREICSWKGPVEKVGDVQVERKGSAVNMVVPDGEDMLKLVASGEADPNQSLVLHRWPADDKLSVPVSRSVPKAKKE